jgi:hypothetical protein
MLVTSCLVSPRGQLLSINLLTILAAFRMSMILAGPIKMAR